METRFPTRAEIGFSKFPLDVGLTLDVELVPLRLQLDAIVKLELNLKFIRIRKVFFKAAIWKYSAPKISKNILNVRTGKPDDTPPRITEMESTPDSAFAVGRETRHCRVLQLRGRDVMDPAFLLEIQAEDDVSVLKMTYSVGTAKGLTDIVRHDEFKGPSAIIARVLPHSIPLYFTVHVSNNQGDTIHATCDLPTYDTTLPRGRVQEDFRSTSNTKVLSAFVVASDDSEIIDTKVAVGLGVDAGGESHTFWKKLDLNKDDNINDGYHLNHFSAPKHGRLASGVYLTRTNIHVSFLCAEDCLKQGDKCRAFNYHSVNKVCELTHDIVGHRLKLSESDSFAYYERKSVGHSVNFFQSGFTLQHNNIHFVNLFVKNILGYSSILSSQPILTDFDPPHPGFIANASLVEIVYTVCREKIIKKWWDRCGPVKPQDANNVVRTEFETDLNNHRRIIDGRGSTTLFNGHDRLIDVRWTRANEFMSANWDGLHDNETSIFGITWAAGTDVCGTDISLGYGDPHAHLGHESQWTHIGSIHPIPNPAYKENGLPDGKYYSTVRATNKVEFGGPMTLTLCHWRPIVVDNSPPLVHHLTDITFEDEILELTGHYNFSDPHSGIKEFDIGLGRTKFDTMILEFRPMPFMGTPEFEKDVLEFADSFAMTHRLPDGVPVWVILRAENSVNLSTVQHADRPILIDLSPPIAGPVLDGSEFKHDADFVGKSDRMCVNWFDFRDDESGIAYYHWQLFQEDDEIYRVEFVDSHKQMLCMDSSLAGGQELQHNTRYRSVITAVHYGHRELSVNASSSGILCDLTYPIVGEIVDGLASDFSDLEYSSNAASVSAQWKGFSDPESDIKEFVVTVQKFNPGLGEWVSAKTGRMLQPNQTSIQWNHFHFLHKDLVRVQIQVTNRAENSNITATSGVLIDLTKPVVNRLYDGLDVTKDVEYQSSLDTISANWDYNDPESGVTHYRYQIFEQSHGTKHQIYPVKEHDWSHELLPNTTHIEHSNLRLKLGGRYFVKIVGQNGALLRQVQETNGVIIDNTPPVMYWVKVDVSPGELEQAQGGYVRQADRTGIKGWWHAEDPESNIYEYFVAVGDQPGYANILNWTSMSRLNSGRLSLDVELNETDTKTRTPVYYVSTYAINGAGLRSAMVTSTPIMVVGQDTPGYLMDGDEPRVNARYQSSSRSLTCQFEGFRSPLYGINHYEWAIGSRPMSENVQRYTRVGIVLHDEKEDFVNSDDAKHEGLPSAGHAQVPIRLEHGRKYFCTVRGVTNAGYILEASSDGITVDRTPPFVKITNLGLPDGSIETAASIYSETVDSLTAQFEFRDSESEAAFASVMYGEHPYGDSMFRRERIDLGARELAGVTADDRVHPLPDGQPNIFTAIVENSLGQKNVTSSAAVVFDSSPPSEGTLHCPQFTKSFSTLTCSWDDVRDPESEIDYYSIMIGEAEGRAEILLGKNVSGDATSFTVHPSEFAAIMEHNKNYFVTLIAYNKVKYSTKIYSKAIIIDDTPPEHSVIVELSDRVQLINGTIQAHDSSKCTDAESCMKMDVTCHLGLDTLAVTWVPFQDPESGISRYEIGLGTTPGATQVMEFTTIPADSTTYTFTGIRLDIYKRLFAVLKGYNGAEHFSTVISSGVFISRVGSDLGFHQPITINDGDHVGKDMDFQTSVEQLSAWWDFSGEPCPVIDYQLYFERLDGLVVQNFTSVGTLTRGSHTGLNLQNGETYFAIVSGTTALSHIITVRSSGVVIRLEPIIPGHVFDGSIAGIDLHKQKSYTQLSCNWMGFGNDTILINPNGGSNSVDKLGQRQAIDYYEVAFGTDRRYPKTRDNVLPFVNVGQNKTFTAYDLDLVPIKGIYYATVRAYSKGFATAEVTSSGIRVGYDSTVFKADVNIPRFVSTANAAEVSESNSEHYNLRYSWNKFTSALNEKQELEIVSYFTGISNMPIPSDFDCKEILYDKDSTGELYNFTFNVNPLSSVSTDTMVKLTDLELEQAETLYAMVIGLDEAGECNGTVASFMFDNNPPSKGEVTAGPFYDMKLSFSLEAGALHVKWRGFEDSDSGLSHIKLQLWRAKGCAPSELKNLTAVADITGLEASVKINDTASISEVTFRDLDLQPGVPYIVTIEAENRAELITRHRTTPILLDISMPTAGFVTDGSNFTEDAEYSGRSDSLRATLLHFPKASTDPCPLRSPSRTEWQTLNTAGLWNVDEWWSLRFRHDLASPIGQGGADWDLHLERDLSSARVLSGAIQADSHLGIGASYSFKAQVANSSRVVTSLVLWNGPSGVVGDIDYVPEEDWSQYTCSCCVFPDPIRFPNCSDLCEGCSPEFLDYLRVNISRDLSQPPPNPRPTRAPGSKLIENALPLPDDTLQGDFDEINRIHSACGLQILYEPADSPAILLWCTHDNNSFPAVPRSFHNYTLHFYSIAQDTGYREWTARVEVDGAMLGVVSGLPSIPQARVTLLAHTKANFVPPLDPDNVLDRWRSVVKLRDLRLPQPTSEKCRYGNAFVAGTNPIVAYSGAVFWNETQVSDWQVLYKPCIPCLHDCDYLHCDPKCRDNGFTEVRLMLAGLKLKDGETYQFGVKATLANGQSAVSLSTGQLVDTTPPEVDNEAPLFYNDPTAPYPYAPTNYTASTTEIRAVWIISDNESLIMEHFWAIGSAPKGTDLQPWTSVGALPSGTNSQLVLTNGRKYFVSVRSVNNAGLATTYYDKIGLTVMTDPPELGNINASLVGVKDFDFEVSPPDAKMQTDQSVVGATLRFNLDKSVEYYEFCISSAEDRLDDILPCIPAPKMNESDAGVTVQIRNNTIHWNDFDGSDENITLGSLNRNSSVESLRNRFFLEPGKTIYIKLHACTKAYVCANRTLSKQTIVPDESLVLQISSLKTQALPVEFRDADRLDMPEVKVIGSYPNGTSLYFEKLTDERTKADYDSSAASHYKPYIVHPEWTKHRTGRLLTRRIREFGTTFAISPIGRATIELQVARSQQLTGVNAAKRRTRRDAAEDETVDSLIYWDA
uniref:GPS domain-containing protein n=1 Tax=Macrostomum lignano TaxID=282301 RepID=A0A1I8J5S5_9PLAT